MPEIKSLHAGSVSIAFTAPARPQSKFDVAPGRSLHIEFPSNPSTDYIALAAKDAEILKEILSKSSKEVTQIMSAVNAGNFMEAKRMAAAIGISEENFIQRGGGMLALIILAIACAVLLAHD